MAGHVQVPKNDEEIWSRSLGYFIWSMGSIEWQTYEWGYKLGGDALKDKLIAIPKFGRRQEVLLGLIRDQSWSEEKKKRAGLLWMKAKGFARFRNIIAHNPVIMNRNYPGLFGIADVRNLTGSHGRFHRIYFSQIVYQTATKMQALARKLNAFFDDYVGQRPTAPTQQRCDQ